jgi:3'-phosphoadenosine 5'-phosphosulfate sulfotransferase (PAPS reductase)/FAD synthetase
MTPEKYLEELGKRFEQIDPRKYCLAYSGGKDSHFLLWFIREYAKIDGITVMGVITRLEAEEIANRIKKNSDVVLMSKLEPMEIKKQYGSPCFSKIQDEFVRRYQNGSRSDNTMKFILGKNPIFKLSGTARELLLKGELPRISSYCCKYLKRQPANEFLRKNKLKTIVGVRADESKVRRAKYKGCFSKDGTFTPIWDLSDEMEKAIYEKYNIELPEIYKYVSRTGCMGCPYAKRCVSDVSNIEKELLLADDSLFEFVCEYFEESYKVLGVDVVKLRERRKDGKKARQKDERVY